MHAFGAGVLNVPEHVNPLRPFHAKQFRPCAGITVFQFFELVPLEPEAAATAGAGQDPDAGDRQGF